MTCLADCAFDAIGGLAVYDKLIPHGPEFDEHQEQPSGFTWTFNMDPDGNTTDMNGNRWKIKDPLDLVSKCIR